MRFKVCLFFVGVCIILGCDASDTQNNDASDTQNNYETCIFDEFANSDGWNTNSFTSRVICKDNVRTWCERESTLDPNGVLKEEACENGMFCYQGECYKNPEGELCVDEGQTSCYKNKLVQCVNGKKSVTTCENGTFCMQPTAYLQDVHNFKASCALPCADTKVGTTQKQCVLDTKIRGDILLDHVCTEITSYNCDRVISNNQHLCEEWPLHGYTERVWVPHDVEIYVTEACEYGCSNNKCLDPVACTESKCDENGNLMYCDDGFYKKQVCNNGSVCQALPNDVWRDFWCDNGCPGYSVYAGESTGGTDCYEECPVQEEQSSTCLDDTYLEVYKCALVDGVYYKQVRVEYLCEHGCKNNACVIYSENEGKACPKEGMSECNGNISSYCQGGYRNGEYYTVWTVRNCEEVNRKCISGIDDRGQSVGYCGTGETCNHLGEDRSICYNAQDYNIPNWHQSTLSIWERCEEMDGKLQWAMSPSYSYCATDLGYQCINGSCQIP